MHAHAIALGMCLVIRRQTPPEHMPCLGASVLTTCCAWCNRLVQCHQLPEASGQHHNDRDIASFACISVLNKRRSQVDFEATLQPVAPGGKSGPTGGKPATAGPVASGTISFRTATGTEALQQALSCTCDTRGPARLESDVR